MKRESGEVHRPLLPLVSDLLDQTGGTWTGLLRAWLLPVDSINYDSDLLRLGTHDTANESNRLLNHDLLLDGVVYKLEASSDCNGFSADLSSTDYQLLVRGCFRFKP